MKRILHRWKWDLATTFLATSSVISFPSRPYVHIMVLCCWVIIGWNRSMTSHDLSCVPQSHLSPIIQYMCSWSHGLQVACALALWAHVAFAGDVQWSYCAMQLRDCHSNRSKQAIGWICWKHYDTEEQAITFSRNHFCFENFKVHIWM